ncbi:restriction endonuclease subunit S [Enterobacter asburiae]|uniref:restriction endonuclease subunit S n=1 Tax=Enterobacter asburiae TaxID=61645 RepID=UPI00042A7721|nr:restriction endonuclease subunit S [Enterobacter asburiae]AHW95848.1 hypothetical protein DI57_15985 [Enterobacter asburiae L1]
MVPKLRFKGFNEPWSETSLGNISSFITSGSRDWAQYYSDGGDKFIRMTNLVRDGIVLNLSDLKFVCLPESSNEGKRTALQHHDILISITAELGKLGWVPDDLGTAYINQHTALVRPNLSISSSKFIANLLSTTKYNNLLNQHNDAGAKSGLNLSTIKQFIFYAPHKIEQTKIADFLSSVDEKITLLNKQYVLLCQYKKGMMQKIFSQEFRFKDENGREFPEWSETLLGGIATFYNGRAYKQTEWENNGTPVIRLQNLTGSGTEYYYSNLKLPDHQYCDNGDLLYMWSATMGPVWWKGPKAIFHYHIWKVVSIYGKSIEGFLYYTLDNITQRMLNEANGTTMAHITKSGIEKECVYLPSLREQIKIANFLSRIDEKISIKKAELDKLKIWKQGLLQQMFV